MMMRKMVMRMRKIRERMILRIKRASLKENLLLLLLEKLRKNLNVKINDY
jgi:hypothetical protein